MTASRSKLEAGEIRGLIGPNGAGQNHVRQSGDRIEIPTARGEARRSDDQRHSAPTRCAHACAVFQVARVSAI